MGENAKMRECEKKELVEFALIFDFWGHQSDLKSWICIPTEVMTSWYAISMDASR